MTEVEEVVAVRPNNKRKSSKKKSDKNNVSPEVIVSPPSSPAFKWNLLCYFFLILVCVLGIYTLFTTVFPLGLSGEEDCQEIWQALGLVSNTFKTHSDRIQVVWACGKRLHTSPGAFAIYLIMWIALKAFAIPGSMVLCVALGGFLSADALLGQVIATVGETVGGCLCFGLSKAIGKPLLVRFFPTLLAKFHAEMEKKRDKLFFFALSVRISPLIPNWFVNCASPVVGIPFRTFLPTLLLGTQIAIFLSLRTGKLLYLLMVQNVILGEIESGGDDLLQTQAIQSFAILMVAQFVVLLPVYFANNTDKKKEL